MDFRSAPTRDRCHPAMFEVKEQQDTGKHPLAALTRAKLRAAAYNSAICRHCCRAARGVEMRVPCFACAALMACCSSVVMQSRVDRQAEGRAGMPRSLNTGQV